MNHAPLAAGKAPALRFAAFGGPEVLACQDIPVTGPGAEEALVRVRPR